MNRPRLALLPWSAGFALLEVLVALGIFTIAIAAVATIFPIAIKMQKETNDALMSQQIKGNIVALLQSDPYSEATLAAALPQVFDPADPNYALDNEKVFALPDQPDLLRKWPLSDLGYPSGNLIRSAFDRPYYWVPLVQMPVQGGTKKWRVIVFLLASGQDRVYSGRATTSAGADWDDDLSTVNPPDTVSPAAASAELDAWLKIPYIKQYPAAATDPALAINGNRFDFDNEPRLVRAGEQFIDNLGRIYRALEADAAGVRVDSAILPDSNGNPPDALWYAPTHEGGRRSPTLHVFWLDPEVVGP